MFTLPAQDTAALKNCFPASVTSCSSAQLVTSVSSVASPSKLPQQTYLLIDCLNSLQYMTASVKSELAAISSINQRNTNKVLFDFFLMMNFWENIMK